MALFGLQISLNKIQKFCRHHRTLCDDGGMVAESNHANGKHQRKQEEREVKAEYQKEKELGQACTLPPEKQRDSFSAFVNDVWFPLQICNGNDKQTTITFYKNMKKLIVEHFDGMVLQEIGPMHIQKFLVYLSNDYKTQRNKAVYEE